MMHEVIGRQHKPHTRSAAAAARPLPRGALRPRWHQRHQRRPGRCLQLQVARPHQQPPSSPDEDGGSSSGSSPSTTDGLVSSNPAGAVPGTSADLSNSGSPDGATAAAAQAKQELLQAWVLLKDAAGSTFVPGYKPQAAITSTARTSGIAGSGAAFTRYSSMVQQAAAQQQQQQQEVQPLPDRVWRLLSGDFIRQRAAAAAGPSGIQPQQQQQQPQDTQAAAVRFELLQQGFQLPGQQQQQPEQQQQDPPAQTAAAAAAQWGGSFPGEDSSGFYPATTQLLVFAMWGVFALQWWGALPELWAAVRGGSWWQPGAAVLLMLPDTPPTHSLCLDLSMLQQGQGWWRLASSALCNSGLAATWLCCAALRGCGALLEAGMGQLQLLTMFLLCAGGAALGQLLAGRCMLCANAPGTVVGMYTAWALLAAQHLGDEAPMHAIYIQGAVLLALMLALGFVQPAVGVGSIAGGMLGGAVATRMAGRLSVLLRWALAVPVVAGLLLLRVGFDVLKVVWLAGVFLAAAVYQNVVEVVKTVRRL